MESKELMINDWVYNGTNHPIKIKHNYGKSVRYDEGGYSHEVEEKLINPIPLTPKILEANRFHRDCANIWEYVGNQYKTLIRFDVEYYCVVIDCDGQYIDCSIRYVHQLQQALRLCGLNELADNFKVDYEQP